MTVANPSKLELIANSDMKTDRIDAKELARMVQLYSVPESYVPTDEIKECCARVRDRQKLVENRTEYANKIHGLLTEHRITRKVKPLSVRGREFFRKLSLPGPWDTLLASHLTMIKTLTDEIDRFNGHKAVVSYAGLNPAIRESPDSWFEGGISKRGSGRLRWILVQCAHVAVHTCHDEYLSRFLRSVGRKKELEESARRNSAETAGLDVPLLNREEVYDPPGVNAWQECDLSTASGGAQ